MRVTLIGAGNLATRLGLALHEAGHTIVQVYSRTMTSARELADKINAEPVIHPQDIRSLADVYICALRDDALDEVLQKVTLKNPLLIHTAGSLPLEVLAPYSDHTGVLYFFQTFSKQRPVDFSHVPVYTESDDPEVRVILNNLALSLGGRPECITSVQRQALHLAAVYACNFVNYMYDIAYDLTEKNGLDFAILLPLIRETALKVEGSIPGDVQTGPAVRSDYSVMNKHLALLEQQPHLKAVYQLLSDGIQTAHKHKA